MPKKRGAKLTKKKKESAQKQCPFLFSKNGEFLSEFEIKDKLVCNYTLTKTLNKRPQKLFYEKKNNELKYIGKEASVKNCFNIYNKHSKKRHIDYNNLCRSKIHHKALFVKIKEYLLTLNKREVSDVVVELLESILLYTKSELTYKEVFSEILNGAYITIKNDNGYIYKKLLRFLKDNKVSSSRGRGGMDGFSSHFSNKYQYRVGDGDLFSMKNKKSSKYDLLFGQRPIVNNWQYEKLDYAKYFLKNQGSSWFQFERSRLSKTLSDKFSHGISSIKYLLTGKNQGPFGSSEYTEYNPLVLELCAGPCNLKNKSSKRKSLKSK